MAARSEAEVTSLLVYKSPAWKGGALYSATLRKKFAASIESPKRTIGTGSIKVTHTSGEAGPYPGS
jgi:hypothetical protein